MLHLESLWFIAEGHNIAERVDCFAKSNVFVTLKDHKENFQWNAKCRLISPAKSEIDNVIKFLVN